MRLECSITGKQYTFEKGLLHSPETINSFNPPLYKKFPTNYPFPSKKEIISRWLKSNLSPLVFAETLGSWYLANQNHKVNEWEKTVKSLHESCLSITGKGINRTPFISSSGIARGLGIKGNNLFIKDESQGLMGSHKARHLLGSILYLETLRSMQTQESNPTPLAIFSCGNAALGAAAIARAANYKLYTFVPFDISTTIEKILTNLDAGVVKVKRAGSVGQGDPCNNRYKEAISRFNWVPFSCYGADIWPSIEGCELLALEFYTELSMQNANLDSVVIQIGGGGLANSFIQGTKIAKSIGLIDRYPRIHTCQTDSCYPLANSYCKILQLILNTQAFSVSPTLLKALQSETSQNFIDSHAYELCDLARNIAENFQAPAIQQVLKEVARNRTQYFTPWTNNVPHSIAEGILDDTTYDGLEVVMGMLETGGLPVVLSEEILFKAVNIARQEREINISATGTAGLAGLMQLIEIGSVNPNENIGLLFTGVEDRSCNEKVKNENIFIINPEDDLQKITNI